MMTVLLESAGAREPRGGGWTAASVSVHVILIAAAIAVTMQAPATANSVPQPPLIVVYEPPPPVPAPTEPAGPSFPGEATISPVVIHVPTVPTFDVGPSFTPTVPSGDIFERRRGQMIPTVPASPGGVQTAAAVDQLAAPLPGNGAPQYPGPLRTAAVEGSVVVTFVVDTTGRAEPTSITIISATHALFADAVRQWLARTRYVPAEIHGRRVRQLVQQEVGFNLKQ